MKPSNRYFILAGILLFSKTFTVGLKEFEMRLEPGHFKQEFESIEEVKNFNNDTYSEEKVELKEEVLDVGYYLRRFKFYGYDPRYTFNDNIPEGNFFAGFPFPPLKNIHWEVKKHCEFSFTDCVTYLQKIVNQMILPRHLDSLTIAKKNEWSIEENIDSIKIADNNCYALLKKEENTFKLFSGSLQKFQWLTSASYYMCWFTMKEIDHLKVFAEDCDNFASCIDWEFGIHNGDFRANNVRPFACALYSFCPDPCCPVRYTRDPISCSEFDPCLGKDAGAKGPCRVFNKKNVCMESIALNRWNTSCECSQIGMRWDAESGICTDVDECMETPFPCDFPSETCLNYQGGYNCVCSSMGYRENPKTNKCELDSVMQTIFNPSNSLAQNKTEFWFSKFFTFLNEFKSVISTSS